MPRSVRSYSRPWKSVFLLCGKCTRKLDGGFGRKRNETLRSALKAALKQRGIGREFHVVETRCMGICPKKAVSAINARRPGRVLTVPKGTDADEVLTRLMEEPPERVV